MSHRGTRLYEYNKDDDVMQDNRESVRQDVRQEVLWDVKNGNVVDWRGHKGKATGLSASYLRLGYYRKAEWVGRCGSYLLFKEYEDGIKKLHNADFCRIRLCPMCAWRRSQKVFGQTSKVMDYLTEHYNYRYLFLTLTVKNVCGDHLSGEIDVLFKAFNLLTKRKEFKALSRGWFRCLEVTHNWERDDYHPHFHMVIAVDENYFENPSIYMSHAKWMELWQSCADLDYEPWVDIRRVRPSNENPRDYRKAVAEVAKYAVKANDYLARPSPELADDERVIKKCEQATDEVVSVLDTALHNRRLIAHGGKFKEVHKMLNLDDAEHGDLVHTDNEDEIRQDLNYILVRYVWNVGFGNYIRFDE